MSELMVLGLDWETRGHLRVALDAHLDRMEKGPRKVVIPDALRALRDHLADTSGLERPRVATAIGGAHPEAVLLTYADAGARVTLSERQMRRLVADGSIRAVKVGRARRIHIDELEAFASTLKGD